MLTASNVKYHIIYSPCFGQKGIGTLSCSIFHSSGARRRRRRRKSLLCTGPLHLTPPPRSSGQPGAAPGDQLQLCNHCSGVRNTDCGVCCKQTGLFMIVGKPEHLRRPGEEHPPSGQKRPGTAAGPSCVCDAAVTPEPLQHFNCVSHILTDPCPSATAKQENAVFGSSWHNCSKGSVSVWTTQTAGTFTAAKSSLNAVGRSFLSPCDFNGCDLIPSVLCFLPLLLLGHE